MPVEYYVAWWNLENLLDEDNAPPDRRSDKVLSTIKDDIAGWTPQLRNQKVAQLASVIAQMNGGAGPDLLGVCEVENRFVLDLLVGAVEGLVPGRSYAVAHVGDVDQPEIHRGDGCPEQSGRRQWSRQARTARRRDATPAGGIGAGSDCESRKLR
jgi:hypothetical protein